MNKLKIIPIVLMSLACPNIASTLTHTASEGKVTLLTFDGDADTTYEFQVANDPVMVLFQYFINIRTFRTIKMAAELLVNYQMIQNVLPIYFSLGWNI